MVFAPFSRSVVGGLISVQITTIGLSTRCHTLAKCTVCGLHVPTHCTRQSTLLAREMHKQRVASYASARCSFPIFSCHVSFKVLATSALASTMCQLKKKKSKLFGSNHFQIGSIQGFQNRFLNRSKPVSIQV